MRASATVLLAAAAMLCGLLQASAEAAVALPPDLVALEQKMEALHFNSDRIRLQAEFELDIPLFGPGAPSFDFFLAGEGVQSFSPEDASMVIAGIGGRHEIRVVNGVSYVYEPEVATFDGGRPWVRTIKKSSSQSLVGLGAGGPEPLVSSHGNFAPLAQVIGLADKVEETGPAIVADQPTTEFTLSVGPLALSAWEKLLGGMTTLGAEGGNPTSLTLELFFSAAGLPVRQRFTFHVKSTTVTLTADILALEVPVSVQAPPARKTIGEARLKVLQRKARERRARRCRQHKCLVGIRQKSKQ